MQTSKQLSTEAMKEISPSLTWLCTKEYDQSLLRAAFAQDLSVKYSYNMSRGRWNCAVNQ